MNICVISGSPKGENSITYQTVRYLIKRFPREQFETIHVGQRIRALEKDLSPALDAIGRSDLLLFCYPVYTFIAPSQLHRFIELLKSSGEDISGKFAAQISTSKHFYDVTAHNFIKENCLDMGLRYLGGLSADMEDLLCEQGQRDAAAFWRLVRFRANNKIFEPIPRRNTQTQKRYVPSGIQTPKKEGKDVVIVASLEPGDTDLAAMIEDFRGQYPHRTRVVNLMDYPFSGGCLGCFNCAATGKCIYKDGFDDFLREEIQTASAIVYAFRIKDHSMGARMKLYDDRQFCNGHRTVTAGMPMGYLIRGDLCAEPNLRMIIDGRSEVGRNFLAGAATDEEGVCRLTKTLEYALAHRLTQPTNFLGVGGIKIFRDLIWVMRGMMKADHEFYKAHGLYDFPQKEKATILKMKLVGALLSNPKIKAHMGSRMNEGMLAPYRKVLDRLDLTQNNPKEQQRKKQ